SIAVTALAVALASSAIGADIEFEANARSESRAGYVPSTVNLSDVVRIVDFELTPSAEVSLLSADQALGLRYRPRIFFRIPNDVGEALVLHQFEGLYRWRLAPDLRFTISAVVGRGDVSYGRLVDSQDQTTGATQGSTFPPDLIVHTFSMLALGNVLKNFSPRQTLNTEYRAQYVQAQSNIYVVPDSYLAWVSPTYSHGLDRTNDLLFGLTVGDVGFVNN